MEIRKNDVLELEIVDMSENGEGIGKEIRTDLRTESRKDSAHLDQNRDRYTWFVRDAVIGDRIEARAMKMKKHYGFARLLKVKRPSAARIGARCPAASQCGGCQLQTMSYEEQLRFKERKVYNNLKRIGGLDNLMLPGAFGESGLAGAGDVADGRSAEGEEEKIKLKAGAHVIMEPIIGMKDPWRYRNKAQVPFGKDKEGNVIYGFYAGRSHRIVGCEDCLLGAEENKGILKEIRGWMERFAILPYDEEAHSGLIRHALIRKGFYTGEIMVCLVINARTLPHSDELVRRLSGISGIKSICFNINTEKTNVIMGDEVVSLSGPLYITDEIGGVKYRISPLSFYQVNPLQTEMLYRTALEYANLIGNEIVWDLYCGIGTISLFLAQRAKQVYGVEIVPQAILDARENARINGIQNVEFFAGKAEDILPEQYEKEKRHADVIVVDPPRKGCDTACLDTIVKMQPDRVVYVSCDSATLARDVKYLGERGYEVQRVRCCDMFGWSPHVETVVQLSQRKPDDVIEVDLDLDDLDITASETKATYQQIKQYVLEKYGFKVSSLYVAQVKQKCGLDMRLNYNLPKSENVKQRKCPKEKEDAIMDALKHFKMI